MASSHQPTQIVSRHRTSEGVVTYARRADGGMSVSVEPWASSTRPLAGHRGATCAATPDVRRAQRPRDGSVPPARIALVVTGPRPHRSALVAARRIALARGADLRVVVAYEPPAAPFPATATTTGEREVETRARTALDRRGLGDAEVVTAGHLLDAVRSLAASVDEVLVAPGGSGPLGGGSWGRARRLERRLARELPVPVHLVGREG
jgi:hypothetical protein